MGKWRSETLVAGRILLVLYLLSSGFKRIVGFSDGCPADYMPLLSGILECACALAILAGYRSRLAAGILVMYLVPTFIFGYLVPLWEVQDEVVREREVATALMSLSVIGGLLIFGVAGPGRISIDGK